MDGLFLLISNYLVFDGSWRYAISPGSPLLVPLMPVLGVLDVRLAGGRGGADEEPLAFLFPHPAPANRIVNCLHIYYSVPPCLPRLSAFSCYY